MDTGSINPTGRKFPAYTTAQLKAFVAGNTLSAETRAKMELEIARRDAGLSKTLHEVLKR